MGFQDSPLPGMFVLAALVFGSCVWYGESTRPREEVITDKYFVPAHAELIVSNYSIIRNGEYLSGPHVETKEVGDRYFAVIGKKQQEVDKEIYELLVVGETFDFTEGRVITAESGTDATE